MPNCHNFALVCTRLPFTSVFSFPLAFLFPGLPGLEEFYSLVLGLLSPSKGSSVASGSFPKAALAGVPCSHRGFLVTSHQHPFPITSEPPPLLPAAWLLTQLSSLRCVFCSEVICVIASLHYICPMSTGIVHTSSSRETQSSIPFVTSPSLLCVPHTWRSINDDVSFCTHASPTTVSPHFIAPHRCGGFVGVGFFVCVLQIEGKTLHWQKGCYSLCSN